MEKLFFSPYNCFSCGKPKFREEDDLCPECRKKALGAHAKPDGGFAFRNTINKENAERFSTPREADSPSQNAEISGFSDRINAKPNKGDQRQTYVGLISRKQKRL